jgi:hypothetical protein
MNSFKQVWLSVLIFLLPLASYLHLFFIDSTNLNNLLKSLDFLDAFALYYDYSWSLIYSILVWLAYLILMIICFKTLSNKYLKLFFLFPIYAASRKLLFYSLPLESVFGKPYYAFVSVSIGAIFGMYLYNLAKKTSLQLSSINSLFVVLLILSAFANDFWKLFPSNEESIKFLFFEIKSTGFGDIQNKLYHIFQRSSFIIPLLIWYFYEKKWYKVAILSPIIIYSAQLYNILILDTSELDEIEVFQTLHFIIPLLLVLLLLAKANDNQHIIKYWLANQYNVVETKLKEKYLERDNKILKSRKKIKAKKSKLTELEQLKIDLELELRNVNSD